MAQNNYKPVARVTVRIGDVIDLRDAEVVKARGHRTPNLMIVLRSLNGKNWMYLYADPEFKSLKGRVTAINEVRHYCTYNRMTHISRNRTNCYVELEDAGDAECTLISEKTQPSRVVEQREELHKGEQKAPTFRYGSVDDAEEEI